MERTAKLLREAGCHLLILSDEQTAERCALAGRCAGTQQYSYNQHQWRVAKQTICKVLVCCAKLGMRVAFHHHVGTHVETPEEIDRLFSLFSPEELGLCLDTGHCIYGGGDPQKVLEQHIGRLRCLHFKDGPKLLIQKLGSKGVEAHTRNESYSSLPYPMQVTCSIGGGDGFAAGFLYALYRGRPLPECLRRSA